MPYCGERVLVNAFRDEAFPGGGDLVRQDVQRRWTSPTCERARQG